MKQIVKDDEPRDFAQWKAGDKMAHRPNWNRVPAPVRQSIHASLMREQGFICCYCESSLSGDDSHIEHFRPRERSPELQLDYQNLHCSCQREGAKGEPRHCGHLKGSWFDEELLISPLEEGCERRFRYTGETAIYFPEWTVMPEPRPPSAGWVWTCRSFGSCARPQLTRSVTCRRRKSGECWIGVRTADTSNIIRQSLKSWRGRPCSAHLCACHAPSRIGSPASPISITRMLNAGFARQCRSTARQSMLAGRAHLSRRSRKRDTTTARATAER